MRTLWLLCRRTARKSRGSLVLTLVLATLASTLLTIGAAAMTQFERSFDEQATRLNTEDIVAVTRSKKLAASVVSRARAHADVASVETRPAAIEYASFDLNGGESSIDVVALDASDTSTLGQVGIVEGTCGVDGACLPVSLRAGGYAIGSDFEVRSASGATRRVRVTGFFEKGTLSAMTMGYIAVVLPHSTIQAWLSDPKPPVAMDLIAIRTKPGATPEVVSHDLLSGADRGEADRVGFHISDIALERHNATYQGGLLGALVLAFSLVIVLLAVATLAFLLRTSIRRDFVAIGAQKAVGISSRAIMAGSALPSVFAATLGVLAGVALGMGLAPALARMLNDQSGLSWRPRLTAGIVAAALVSVVGTTLVAAWLSTISVLRVPPVTALRGGHTTHSFHRAILPLDRTRGPLPLLMGATMAWQQRAQSIVVALISAIICFVSVFATVLGGQVLGDAPTLRQTAIGEFDDVEVVVNDPKDAQTVLEHVRKQPDVAKATRMTFEPIEVNGLGATTMVIDDYGFFQQSMVYSGREPRHPNEIAIGGSLAAGMGARVGDEIEVRTGESSQRYLITGLLSSVQYFGRRLNMTTEGYRRLVPNYQISEVAIFLREPTQEKAHDFIEQLRRDAPAPVGALVNSRGISDGILGGLVSTGHALGVGMVGLAGLIAASVMWLLTVAMLVRERTSIGIRKALGFTTGEIMVHTLCTYLPPIAVGIGIGAVASWFATLPTIVALISSMGISHIPTTMRLTTVAAVSVGIAVVALAAVLLASLRLRRLTPYDLMAD